MTPPDGVPPGGQDRPLRSWPLYVLAAPATVAIWSGWVGLGEMTGFGRVHPLPGIADGFAINTAITLPIGVEAYGAYAVGVWLSSKPLSPQTRAFARRSAISALIFGCLGQVVYHLLAAAGVTAAPMWVTTIVACFPVLVLGMGTTLAHLVRRDTRTRTDANRNQVPVPEPRQVQVPAGAGSPDRPDQVRNLPAICLRSVRNNNPNLGHRPSNVNRNPNLNPSRNPERDPTGPEPRRTSEPAGAVTSSPNRPARPRTSPTRTSPRRTGRGELGDRAEKKAREVQQVLNLIEELGYEAVNLAEVQYRLNLSKTTAYHRLTDARNQWNQQAS